MGVATVGVVFVGVVFVGVVFVGVVSVGVVGGWLPLERERVGTRALTRAQ